MKLDLFNETARKLGLPAGNYFFKSKRTKVIYWFMVGLDYDRTILHICKPETARYLEFDIARAIHRKLDQKNYHKKILNFLKKD